MTRQKEADLDERELDKIADELYAVRPDGFAAARDEHIRKAKSEGQAQLARELGRLRKPTQSAWLINLLSRDQRDVVEQFLDLGEELSRAQAEAAGAELRNLMAVRRELEAALIRRAQSLAAEAGVEVSASMEREAQDTLAAALAQPDVANEIRAGRLVKPASYAGFGTPVAARSPAPVRKVAADEAASPPRTARIDILADRAAQRARERREVAERRVEEARAALDAAASALASETRTVEKAQARQEELREEAARLEAELRELQQRLREAREQAIDAERATLAATRRREQAAKAHESSQEAVERAQHQLEDLTRDE